MRLSLVPSLLLIALPAVLSTPTWWLNQEGHDSSSSSTSTETISSTTTSTSDTSSLSMAGSGSEPGSNANACSPNEGSGRGIGVTYASDPNVHSAAWYRQNDIRILNFALIISHLSSAFYTSSLSRYSQKCFEEKGYESWVRNRFEQIAEREEVHVRFLEEAIRSGGGEAVGRCGYIFPDREPPHAIELSEAISSLAVSALTGALKYIESKEYASSLGSILGVEARVSSWVNSAVKKQSPWNMAFETPLTLSQSYSILQNFISPSSCPEHNASLLPIGLQSFPPLRIPSHVEPGVEIEVGFDEARYREGNALYGASMVGTGTYVLPVRVVEERGAQQVSEESQGGSQGEQEHENENQEVKRRFFLTPPEELRGMGTVYITIVQTESGSEGAVDVGRMVRDENTVAGPAIVVFPFDSRGEGIE